MFRPKPTFKSIIDYGIVPCVGRMGSPTLTKDPLHTNIKYSNGIIIGIVVFISLIIIG